MLLSVLLSLSLHLQYVPDSTDSFRTSKKVCKQIESGVTAIFGEDRWKRRIESLVDWWTNVTGID
jgi:hypothetical protein